MSIRTLNHSIEEQEKALESEISAQLSKVRECQSQLEGAKKKLGTLREELDRFKKLRTVSNELVQQIDKG